MTNFQLAVNVFAGLCFFWIVLFIAAFMLFKIEYNDAGSDGEAS